jgi:multiple sugar transport system permease protein
MATVAATRPLARRRSTHLLRKRVLVYAGLTFYAVLAGLPVYWMFVTTFKADRDLYNLQNFPLWFNQAPTLDHLNLLFNKTGFGHWLLNTLIVAVAVVLITLAVAIPAGYALARLRFPERRHCRLASFSPIWCPPRCCFCRWSKSSLVWACSTNSAH